MNYDQERARHALELRQLAKKLKHDFSHHAGTWMLDIRHQRIMEQRIHRDSLLSFRKPSLNLIYMGSIFTQILEKSGLSSGTGTGFDLEVLEMETSNGCG